MSFGRQNNGVLGIDQVVPVLGNDTSGPGLRQRSCIVVALNGQRPMRIGKHGSCTMAGGGTVRLAGFQIK